MLQTLKSTIVLGTLLVVGYGVHVMLIRPPSGDAIWNDAADVDLPDIDFGLTRPDTSLAGEATASPPSAEMSIPSAPAEMASTPSAPTAIASTPEPFSGQGAAPLPARPWETTDPPTPLPAISATQAIAATDPASEGFSPPVQLSPAVSPQAAPITNVSHIAPFDSTWAAAQDKLLNGQLVDALLSLSFLYADDQLRDAQRDQLVERLDQLAGSVIYSQDHAMERPYVVQGGESWEQIAAPYQVPAMFLARVNGLPIESPPTAGTSLKVVRGPFRGELSLSRRELTLFLGRHYAGRFSIGIGRDLPAHVTVMEVFEKSGGRPYSDARTGETIPAGAPENPYGSRWIGLRDVQSVAADLPLGIHSTGSAIGAADTRGCVTVSDRDADDLQAILSLGSRIEVRR